MTTNASDSPTITVAGTIYAPDLTPAVTALVEELEQHGQYVVLSAPTDDIDDVVLRSGLRRWTLYQEAKLAVMWHF